MYSRKIYRSQSIALLAATTWIVAACSSGDRPEPPPVVVNQAPAVSAIANVTTDQDTVVGPIEFGVIDDSTPANQLTVTAMGDATTLVPPDGVVIGGAGAVRSITLTPLEAATGTVNVTVRVIDAQGAATTRGFSVNVNARGASVSSTVLNTFSKGEVEEATPVNGLTFAQDADETTFASLVGDP
jgi:hypothetical protein